MNEPANYYVVRDSACGNGNDDAGQILGIFSSYEKAEAFMKSGPPTTTDSYCYDIEIEGPFVIDPEF